jgi:predicted nucleotidyltransferase
MSLTQYPDIDALLGELRDQHQALLGAKLAGLYLFGSLVWGDFDHRSSDIDLLAALAADLDDRELAALGRMHAGFSAAHPHWRNRVEVAYVTQAALRTFRDQISTIAVISPGEPLHPKAAGRDWLMNWYMVREHGRALAGPPPDALIEPISTAEFVQSIREYAQAWAGRIDGARDQPSQAYAILTLCRALYTVRHGQQASKLQAARWAAQELPQWAGLIERALEWRAAWRDQIVDAAAVFPETRRFVLFVVELIAGT